MSGQGIIQMIKANWPYFLAAGGIAGVFGLYSVYSNKRREKYQDKIGSKEEASKTKETEEQEEEETVEMPTRNISQLLSAEIDEEIYKLTARVEKIHTNPTGYAGILSDKIGKMPFYCQSEESIGDYIAGVLLHESKDNQSDLELEALVESPFEEETSKILCLTRVKGKICGRDYDTGEENY